MMGDIYGNFRNFTRSTRSRGKARSIFRKFTTSGGISRGTFLNFTTSRGISREKSEILQGVGEYPMAFPKFYYEWEISRGISDILQGVGEYPEKFPKFYYEWGIFRGISEILRVEHILKFNKREDIQHLTSLEKGKGIQMHLKILTRGRSTLRISLIYK